MIFSVSPAMSETSESRIMFVGSPSSEFSRLLHSSSPCSSVELELDNSLHPSQFFFKSVDFNLTIADKRGFKRCLYVSIFVLLVIPVLVLLLHFLPHKEQINETSKDLTLALSHALLFFDAQKSGYLPRNVSIPFRGNSGINDGKDTNADLVGGYYDSGNNVKFSFSTAYAVTVLSWTVIEYPQKYAEIGQLDHVKEIIKWGADYLLKLFIIPQNSSSDSAILYSQVGGGNRNGVDQENDVNCWQRPEDMRYPRQVSVCDNTAADLAGEIVAGLSAASLVFAGDKSYSRKLVEAAEVLFSLVTRQDLSHKLGKYTDNEACGGQARGFYNSSGFMDELVWGGTWLFFATGNSTYLKYATENFVAAGEEELPSEQGVFYWNNKLAANAVLMTRIRYFIDLGYPYEDALSTNRTDLLMCSYLSLIHKWNVTDGGLIVLKLDAGAPLQYAATAAFLSKLYSDHLLLLGRTSGSCGATVFSVKMLLDFSASQVNYILGDNPMKLSYLVGYGDHYPGRVHHRAASIPWDGKQHSCSEGNAYLYSKDKNPNNIVGAMVRGPDKNDSFLDDRDKPWFTEPSIASNVGLVAALVALHDPPAISSTDSNDGAKLGIDKMGIFQNVHLNS